MNLNKGFSDNIDQAYKNIFNNNINGDFRRPLQNRKSPLNNNNLRNNNYYTFNKSPESRPYIGEGYCQNIAPNFIKKNDSEYINLDENININDYLIKNQNRKKAMEKSPLNYRVQHNNNYFDYNKNFINNNNIIKNRINALKHFESSDYDDNNMNYQYSEDDINNMNNNWKKKIQKINDQKANYEYFNMYSDNFSNNNKLQNRNNFDNDKNSVNSQSDYSNHNQMLSQSVNINLNQPKKFKFNNKNYNNKNINLSNDNNQKYSQDYYSELSDNNSIKNQTYQNSYKYDFNQNYYNNNDSLSSNFYDESCEKNKTQNYTKKLKNKFSDISKFFNSYKSVNTVSISSQDVNSSSEYYRDDDTYNSAQFKRPMKNDENHYHQNLTIKIKKKDDKNLIKIEKVNNSERPKRFLQYVDNTPEGCNISTNTDIISRTKNISNFEVYPKEKKINNYNLSYNSDYSNISDKNYNNISSSTMFIPHKIQNQLKSNNLSNKNIYINKNKEPLLMNSKQIKLNNKQKNNNVNISYRQILDNRNKFKRRSPQNIMNFNNYNNKLYNLYTNDLSSTNINNSPIKNTFSKFGFNINHNQNNLDNFQNRTEDTIYDKQPKFQKEKKIKEITVDLSPRKNFFNLSNSNGDLNNKINNITSNYNYNFNNNINGINRNDFDSKFNFNNINIKPKAKIESCIITFDKNKNNKKFKLSNSLDGLKAIRTKKYIKKKIIKGTESNTQNNNNYKFNETPGMNMNNSKNKNNIITNKFIYNKNKSPKAIYQKPGNSKLSNSFGKILSTEEDNNEGVQDYCAPSPDYGRRGKNLDDNLLSNIYNHSPLLISGNFKVIDNEKKEQQNPYSPKYEEFSFKQKLNSDANDENYTTSKPVKVKIINENNNNNLNNNNKNDGSIKNIYMKKTKTNNKLNNVSNNNNNNFNLFTSQRIPTFSNIDEIIKKENNSNISRINEDNDNINDIIHNNKKSSGITPFGINEIPKNEKPIIKLIVKSFSNKKIEPKVKSQLSYSFFRKYYKLYMKLPKIESIYISKCFLKPAKKPLTSISYISKNKFRNIYKIPKSSCEYFTKKVIPNTLILPKIDLSYISKIFIKNKEYIENRLNNIGNDKLLNNNNIKLSVKKNINSQNKPIKKRIILIRKTKKANKKLYDNNSDNNYANTYVNNDDNIIENNAAALPIINNEEIEKCPFRKLELKNTNNKKEENISTLIKEEVTNISDKNEEINKNIDNTVDATSDYSSKKKVNNINKDINIKNDKIYIKKKKILQNIMRREKRLPEEKKFDNELSIDSLDNDLSFNLNINKIKNESNNDSKVFKYYNNNKSIDTSTIKSQSNNTSINEGMNKTSSSFYNMIKINALSFSINNNLNNSNNEDLSMISNNTMNLEIDKFHNSKKNNFKIRTIIRGIKKKSKHDFLKNFKNKNIKISDLLKKHIKTKKDIDKEKKVNSIIKEDLENFILFYKDKINDNKKIKYDWSMIEQLMIKIKLDIVDIIFGYLKACEEVVDSKKIVIVATEYIKNIIHHYKYNYLTNKNFNNIHNKILKIYLSVKNIKVYDSLKFNIYGKLLYVLINNELFFLSDLNILKQADEQTRNNIKKILNNSGNEILISKFIN